MAYELLTKAVDTGNGTLIVSQSSNMADVKRDLMITEADERWKEKMKDVTVLNVDQQAGRYLETVLYPTLVACTSGEVPTLEEFLYVMPAVKSREWVTAAREMNPQWFPDLALRTPEEQEAELEKKE